MLGTGKQAVNLHVVRSWRSSEWIRLPQRSHHEKSLPKVSGWCQVAMVHDTFEWWLHDAFGNILCEIWSYVCSESMHRSWKVLSCLPLELLVLAEVSVSIVVTSTALDYSKATKTLEAADILDLRTKNVLDVPVGPLSGNWAKLPADGKIFDLS